MGILVKPIVTEKMTAEGEKRGRYGFIVDSSANKIEIRKAVEEMYGVTVKDVNTVNYNGKAKSVIQRQVFLQEELTSIRRLM